MTDRLQIGLWPTLRGDHHIGTLRKRQVLRFANHKQVGEMNTTAYWTSSASLPKFDSLSHDLETDVAIIGGGLTGLTAAYLLTREGAKVAVLERQRCGG